MKGGTRFMKGTWSQCITNRWTVSMKVSRYPCQRTVLVHVLWVILPCSFLASVSWLGRCYSGMHFCSYPTIDHVYMQACFCFCLEASSGWILIPMHSCQCSILYILKILFNIVLMIVLHTYIEHLWNIRERYVKLKQKSLSMW